MAGPPPLLAQSGDTESVYIKNTRERFVPCAKKAGLEDGYTWHCNRHSFGSRLTMAGVDLRTVAQLMGHRNIQMTMRYSQLALITSRMPSIGWWKVQGPQLALKLAPPQTRPRDSQLDMLNNYTLCKML
jgi:integrase